LIRYYDILQDTVSRTKYGLSELNLGYAESVKNRTVMAPPALYTASDTNAMSHRLFKGSPNSFYF